MAKVFVAIAKESFVNDQFKYVNGYAVSIIIKRDHGYDVFNELVEPTDLVIDSIKRYCINNNIKIINTNIFGKVLSWSAERFDISIIG